MAERWTIWLGSDHAGHMLRRELAQFFSEAPHIAEMHELGPVDDTPVDYPGIAVQVAQAVLAEPTHRRGILLCRSGEGMEIAANRLSGIRAALVWDPAVAQETRADNDANILVLPSQYVTPEVAKACVEAFLTTPFSNLERHQRRIAELDQIGQEA